jgi:hypothetical protein
LFRLPSPDLPDRIKSNQINRQIEKLGEPFAPLIQKLGSMNEYQGICSPRRRSRLKSASHKKGAAGASRKESCTVEFQPERT